MSQLGATALSLPDSLEAIQDRFDAEGWTDGLPIVPPTPARAEAMLVASGGEASHSVGLVPPRYGDATLQRLAVNAVMAGCRPAYFPVVVAAVKALLHPEFNLFGIQTTTHPATPALLVSGPIAAKLGLQAGAGACGPGWRANATIGRAVRLILLNVGGAVPGVFDRATHGSPAKYSCCFAENTPANPWLPWHVEQGYDAGTSTVTAIAIEGAHNVNDHGSTTPEELLRTVAGALCSVGSNNPHYTEQGSQVLVVLSPEHAATIARSGWSKDQVRQFLFDQARLPLSRLARENVERKLLHRWGEALRRAARSWLDNPAAPEPLLPVAAHWPDVLVAVVGGPGKHSLVFPTFGPTRAATEAIDLPQGGEVP